MGRIHGKDNHAALPLCRHEAIVHTDTQAGFDHAIGRIVIDGRISRFIRNMFFLEDPNDIRILLRQWFNKRFMTQLLQRVYLGSCQGMIFRKPHDHFIFT